MKIKYKESKYLSLIENVFHEIKLRFSVMNKIFLTIIVMSLVFFISFLMWSYHVSSYYKVTGGDYYNSYSPWGDSFAPFNVIISFLSIIGLIVTIYIQMQNSIEQSDNSAKQWRLSYKQNFDSNFYNFLSVVNKMKENIRQSGDVLLSIEIRLNGLRGFMINKEISEEDLLKVKNVLFIYQNPQMRGIFTYETNIIFIENIFTQMKKIYDNDLLEESEKKTYMNILFSNLDENTLLLLGLYAIKTEDIFIQDVLRKFDRVVNLLVNGEKYPEIRNLTAIYYR